MSITRLVKGSAPSLVKTEKGNELIDAINSLLRSEGESPIEVRFESATGSIPAKMVISLDEEALNGLPEGFEEETLDIVQDDNTAGQRIFLTKAVT
jgi:hypothetical protein